MTNGIHRGTDKPGGAPVTRLPMANHQPRHDKTLTASIDSIITPS